MAIVIKPSGNTTNGVGWFSIGLTIKADSDEVAILKQAEDAIRAKFAEDPNFKDFLNNGANFVRGLLKYALEAELPEEE